MAEAQGLPSPPQFANLIANMRQVIRLLQIHSQVTKPGPGRKHDVDVLHKSAIVLIVACWEAFVEDLAEEALSVLIQHATRHSVFPDDVLERVASKCGGKKAWDLAGDGWRTVMRDHYLEVLAKTTGKLNTPKTEQVNELFDKVLGLKKVSSGWKWPGASAAQAARRLDALVTLRGSIAHRVEATAQVRKKTVNDARKLVVRLAVTTHNQVNDWISARSGHGRPWARASATVRASKGPASKSRTPSRAAATSTIS